MVSVSLHRRTRPRGFTLIELLVVMAILGALLAIAAPRYFESVERAKETALRTNLRMLREAIDKHRADTGRSPATLDELVSRRYLRHVPVDPVTDRADSWLIEASPDATTPGIHDVRSGAPGHSRDGSPYAAW
jgi:general secretion pathway protein G